MAKLYPPEKLERILNLSTSGLSSYKIARWEHVSLDLIRYRTRSAGIKLESRELPDEKVQEIYRICELLERPTVAEVAGLTGISMPAVSKYMLKAGYKPKIGKPPISEERSALILSLYLSNLECSNSEIAYAAGENVNTVYKHLKDNGYKSHCKQGFPDKKKTKSLDDKLKG